MIVPSTTTINLTTTSAQAITNVSDAVKSSSSSDSVVQFTQVAFIASVIGGALILFVVLFCGFKYYKKKKNQKEVDLYPFLQNRRHFSERFPSTDDRLQKKNEEKMDMDQVVVEQKNYTDTPQAVSRPMTENLALRKNLTLSQFETHKNWLKLSNSSNHNDGLSENSGSSFQQDIQANATSSQHSSSSGNVQVHGDGNNLSRSPVKSKFKKTAL
ncbi:hypothetical protein HK099_005341 [Clydaea vesicula]|uniref:Uncharacterized protein n=1 Tax=Clydaea vesicula TaxID=447962 RepID=A0AAD5XYP9_9FUNG|nr:hypothetical protein HK099_005341 [Clydaea vesicula]